MEDFKNTLNFLDELNNEFNVPIWIPSKNQTINFKEITTLQQKNILSCSVNDSIYNKEFNKTIVNIIKENAMDSFEDFTIIDKNVICIGLKNKIDSVFTIENKNVKTKFNLDSILKNIETKYKHPEKSVIKTEFFVIELETPLLSVEKQYEDEIITDVSTNKIQNIKELQNVFSDAFIGEIAKHIKTVIVKDTDINYSQLPFDKKIQVVEKINGSTLKQILEVINNWKREFDQFLTAKNKEPLKIDPFFFIS
jgi:hypothetical protein